MVTLDTPGRAALTVRRRPTRAVPVTLVLSTFVVALMGRFTLDRLGVERFAELDLRLIAYPALTVAVLLWRFRPDNADYRHTWSSPLQWALAAIGYLALTAFWAPFGARTVDLVTDLALLALLVVLVAAVSAPDPARARGVMLGALYVAGLVYALAGLVLGETDQQGRTAAFGGGPNVYVRVVFLGVIAAVALAVIHRKKLFLLPVPLLGLAALPASSRGGVLAAVATAAVFLLLCWRRLTWRMFAAALLVVGACLVAALTLFDPTETARIGERFSVDAVQENQFSGRPKLFTQALTIFLERPVVGGGLDSFFVRFGFSQDLSYPHNLVLDVAATGGLIGLGLLVVFAASLVRHCRPVARMSHDRLAMLAGVLFVTAASLFSGDFYDSRFLWIFAVLAVNCPAEREQRAGPTTSS